LNWLLHSGMAKSPMCNMVEQVRKGSYQAGYSAALQEVVCFINANLGKKAGGWHFDSPALLHHGGV
jgi:hypothetical protein